MFGFSIETAFLYTWNVLTKLRIEMGFTFTPFKKCLKICSRFIFVFVLVLLFSDSQLPVSICTSFAINWSWVKLFWKFVLLFFCYNIHFYIFLSSRLLSLSRWLLIMSWRHDCHYCGHKLHIFFYFFYL